jgi:hypothetical protein
MVTLWISFFSLFVNNVIAAEHQFTPLCNYSGVISSDSAIPVVAGSDIFKHLKGYSDYYQNGQKKCFKLLHNSGDLNGLSSLQKEFLSRYGILFVEFGPISDCPTYSRCWFGLLSCGTFKLENFLEEYDHERKHNPLPGLTTDHEESPILPFRDIPSFLGWSMQSLHFQFRVVGPEILFPEVTFVPSENILLCSYALTVPGSYRIEIMPREFYPGVLFNYNETERTEGYHILGYQQLLTSVTPVIISRHMTSSPGMFCNERDQEIKTILTPLPFCSRGNHRGRYLTIPSESLRICGAEKIFPIIATLQKSDNLGDEIFATKLERQYIASNHLHHEKNLREFLLRQSQDSNVPLEQRLRAREILRHTDENSSLCSLIIVNDLPIATGLRDTRHEIFAPYKCRYKLYSPLQVSTVPP